MVSLGHSRSDLRGECLAQPVHTPGSWDLALRIAKGVPGQVGELILQSCRSLRVLHCLKSRERPGFSGDALLNDYSDIDVLSTREMLCNACNSPAVMAVVHGCSYIVQPGNVKG